MAEHIQTEEDNTEQKIRQVAKRLFTERGYAGTKIRDVAEEAGVNIALLNYYFRSKERLYESILSENFEEYASAISETLNAQDIPLHTRIKAYVSQLIEHLENNPDLPFFIMSECRNNSEFCVHIMDKKMRKFNESVLAQQLKKEAEKGNIRTIDPMHFEHMVVAQIVMPFLGAPVFKHVHQMDDVSFKKFMDEQKDIVPDMIMAYLKNTQE
ncbi:TetR/AcrR family transcriptional regulator [Porifericola rhodea]|uniref:TetR/AcrR family transcriptional regulator n=1 Tax=Porifericola rhodea TaxID=930972 RepID=UPI0026657A6C|nr:TetR/AcrR family transcriptional regulator [Porifericola rhodea]WKN29803.1 TetR/AcrR family transcriptional regulator [Porifericola rhodea]